MKKVLVMNDIACVGNIAGIAQTAILSALQCEVSLLPTMLLSSHTGNTYQPVRMDTTTLIEACIKQWKEEGVTFDGILVGYVSNVEVLTMIHNWLSKKSVPIIVDPVMADNGNLYKGFSDEFVLKLRDFVRCATHITPNWTEACLLANQPYCETPSLKEVELVLSKLRELTNATIVITGVKIQSQSDLTVIIQEESDAYKMVRHSYCEGHYIGTGDVFSSLLLGALMHQLPLILSIEKATTCLVQMIERTPIGSGRSIYYEPLLSKIIDDFLGE